MKRWWYQLTARFRHGPQCAACDRRDLCKIIKAGSRPCDVAGDALQRLTDGIGDGKRVAPTYTFTGTLK